MAGNTREDPIAITALPFTYTVPGGYTYNDVYFSLPSGVDAWPAWLVASTVGSPVTKDFGLTLAAPRVDDPYWSVQRQVPLTTGSGSRSVAVIDAAPLNSAFVVGIHTTGIPPGGLQIQFYLQTLGIQGTVFDSTGAPAERSLALITRDPIPPYDSLGFAAFATSDAVTGAFSLEGEVFNGEYIVLAFDDASRNDIVARVSVTTAPIRATPP